MAIDADLLKSRLQDVRRIIRETAHDADRDPDTVTLIGVTKFFPAEFACAAVLSGLPDLGENRVQEMLAKRDELASRGLTPNWHLIGSLQKNKVRLIIGKTHLIHSMDSISLLEEVDRRSRAAELVTDVLVQVNIAGESSKHGFTPAELMPVIEQALRFQGIRLRGLMTMAPLFPDADLTLPVFNEARNLFHLLSETVIQDKSFNILSMGMSHDYVQAIRCGATHVRIGSAIFGPRPPELPEPD